jgi:hypothetical protein
MPDIADCIRFVVYSQRTDFPVRNSDAAKTALSESQKNFAQLKSCMKRIEDENNMAAISSGVSIYEGIGREEQRISELRSNWSQLRSQP